MDTLVRTTGKIFELKLKSIAFIVRVHSCKEQMTVVKILKLGSILTPMV